MCSLALPAVLRWDNTACPLLASCAYLMAVRQEAAGAGGAQRLQTQHQPELVGEPHGNKHQLHSHVAAAAAQTLRIAHTFHTISTP